MTQYKILVPIDFSDCSVAALDAAMSIAKSRDASVTLLHVDPGLIPFYDEELGILEPTRFFHHLKLLAAERAAQVDSPVQETVIYGEPVDVIVKTASEENVDLIVMGSHGRTGLDRTLMGSVAEGVLRRAPCPVMCVKSGANKRPQRPETIATTQTGDIA